MNSIVRRSFVARPAAPAVVALIIALIVVTAALAGPDSPRIVGGQEAGPGEWPWQVALVQKGAGPFDGQFCGGSLLTRDWVMTAAHCADDFTIEDFDVVAGIHDLALPDPDYRRVAVAEIVIHPGYDPYFFDNDLALLRLAEPIDERPAAGVVLPIAYVTAAGEATGALVGTPSTVTGWGNTLGQPDPGGTDYAERLQEVEVPVVSNDFCNGAYGGGITPGMICAGVFKGGKGPCYGDSGGPMVVYDAAEARWEQVGIVSFGIGCAYPGAPAVFTRVSHHAAWIHETTHPLIPTNWAYLASVLDTLPVPSLTNGDFESGQGAGWEESTTSGTAIILPAESLQLFGITPHSGLWAASMGGYDYERAVLSQEMLVPTDQPYLHYFHWTASIDACGYDFIGVYVNSIPVVEETVCIYNMTGIWMEQVVDLTAYAGQGVMLEFILTTDSTYSSNWYIDDVSFSYE